MVRHGMVGRSGRIALAVGLLSDVEAGSTSRWANGRTVLGRGEWELNAARVNVCECV